MFCNKCGNKVNENDNVCSNCGNVLKNIEGGVNSQTPVPQKKKSNIGFIIVVIVLVLLIGIAAVLYFTGVLVIKSGVTEGNRTTTEKVTTEEVITTTTTTTKSASNKIELSGYVFNIPYTFRPSTKDEGVYFKIDNSYAFKFKKIGRVSNYDFDTNALEESLERMGATDVSIVRKKVNNDNNSVTIAAYSYNGAKFAESLIQFDEEYAVSVIINLYNADKIAATDEIALIALDFDRASNSFADIDLDVNDVKVEEFSR